MKRWLVPGMIFLGGFAVGSLVFAGLWWRSSRLEDLDRSSASALRNVKTLQQLRSDQKENSISNLEWRLDREVLAISPYVGKGGTLGANAGAALKGIADYRRSVGFRSEDPQVQSALDQAR